MSAASPSIVRVEGARRAPSSGIVWAPDLVVTAAHTIRARDGIRVVVDDTPFDATVAGGDGGTDIALLRVENASLAPIRWSEREPRAGHVVLAAGRPGRSVHAAFGIVSAPAGEFIDVDGFLPRGFSGGPLLSSDGALGMNTSRLAPGGTTIARAMLQRIVDELLRSGAIRRPLIGVAVYPVEDGLLVISSHREEILVGDIVTKVGGHEVRSPGGLERVVRELEIGREIEIALTRGGEPRVLRVEVRSR